MAVGNVKGFKVYDEENDESGIAHLATDAYADSSVTTAKVANGAITNAKHGNGSVSWEKLASAVQTRITDAEGDIDTINETLEEKANIDGNYDNLTVGQAEQLVSTVYVDDSEPYNFRTAGGSADIGDRVYEEVVGGSIVWNQLYTNNNFETRTGWAANNDTHGVVSATDNVLTLTLGANVGSSTYLAQYISPRTKLWNGHVYVQMIDVNPSKDTACEFMYGGIATGAGYTNVSANTWTRYGDVIKMTSDYSAALFYINWTGQLSEGDTVQFKNAFLCDLTQMFGSTIADYIYSLEQSTAGAGVAWFRNLFPKPYYAYNTGTLMSVKAGAHKTVGFNALDRSACENNKMIAWTSSIVIDETGSVVSDYIPVTPAQYRSKYAVYAFGYDADKNYVGVWRGNVNRWTIPAQGDAGWLVNSFTVDTGIAYVRVVYRRNTGDIADYTKIDDLCLHLEWDGERNGQYEPYELHEYPLAELELRGIPKLDANNQLYYDGDTYASDGTVTRRFGVIDFGDLDSSAFAYIESDNYSSWAYDGCRINVSGMNTNGNFFITNSAYRNVGYFTSWSTVPQLGDMVVGTSGAGVIFRNDNLTTAAAFKTALTGTYLVYELATPTTETADTFVNPQVVDDFGTEEYTDFAVEAGDRDVAIPVGHNSQYMNNLRAKLEMAPESPDGDGKYIVQQTNGENAYIPYTADGRLDALEAKVPAPPSANGTYKLTATVTDGGVTYTWVAG